MNFKSKSSLITQKSRSITPLVKSQNQSVKRTESIIETSIQRNKSYNKENLKPNPGIRPKTPNISAKCWVAINNKNGEILIQKNSQQQRQVASLTKIMTFMTTLKICESLKIPIKTQLLVSKNAASQEGTSANLLHGSLLSIEDLLYALMLPSGNDAAVVLAEGLGNCLKQRILSTGRPPTYSAVIPFISQMQQLSLEMNLNSKWANPHGLSNQYNKSSAYDLAQLCKTAMEQDLFKNIVKTKEYKCWKNTNKLLFEGWEGIKTGVTPAAGPCLAATVNGIIIVLLGCKSMEHRWEECREIYNQLYIQ